MTTQELQKLVETISLMAFNKPFSDQASFNVRLKTTGGRYLLQSHNIEINPRIVELDDSSVLVGIIKHELVHYHLHQLGVMHTHASVAFKALLNEVDGLRYTPVMQPVKRYQYQCGKCGLKYFRQRKIDLNKYHCGKCLGALKKI